MPSSIVEPSFCLLLGTTPRLEAVLSSSKIRWDERLCWCFHFIRILRSHSDPLGIKWMWPALRCDAFNRSGWFKTFSQLFRKKTLAWSIDLENGSSDFASRAQFSPSEKSKSEQGDWEWIGNYGNSLSWASSHWS